MAAVTGPQYRLMAGAAHNPAMARRTGISQEMAKEFVEKTPAAKRSKWSHKPKGLYKAFRRHDGG